MRILFFGTPEYAVPSLRRLAGLAPRHVLAGVVSQPDKPKGRVGAPSPPPVVEVARELGLPGDAIFQPERSPNKRGLLASLKALQPDVLCVVAYGALLKSGALALPSLCALNAHGSLLPRYRGASPIQAALLAGEAQTGVSIMRMELALDAGPVLLSRAVPIAPGDTAGTLHDRLAELSAQCFVEALELLDQGQAVFTPQDHARASYTGKLEKTSGRVDWSRDAPFLERFVRAMDPWPGAWSSIALPDGSQPARIRIARAVLSSGDSLSPESGGDSQFPAVPGVVAQASSAQAIDVQCGGGGSLQVTAVQPEGKRAMSTAEFLGGTGRKYAPASLWR